MPLRVALIAIGLGLGLWARGVAVDSAGISLAARTAWGWVYLLVVGWSAMIAAVIVWPTRRRSAMLLYAVGCWWFLAELADPSVGVAIGFTLGLVAASAGPALVAHLALSYPAGRLPGWPAGLIVAVGYVVMVGALGVAGTALFDPVPMGCVDCPANVMQVADVDPATFDQASGMALHLALAWSIAAFGAVVWRLVSAHSGLRASTMPIALPAAGFLGAWLTRSLIDRSGGATSTVGIWYLEGACQIAVAATMVAEIWRSRRARRSLSRLVIQLTGATSGGLRAALAARLNDPDMLLAYPIDHGRRHVDADARPVDLTSTGGRTLTALVGDGVELASLVHRPGVLTDAQQVDDLLSSVRLSLDNERLAAQDRVQLEEIRSSGARIVAAADAERRRIERDLHDGAQQRLVALLLTLRLIRADVTLPTLEAAENELRQAVSELRQLAHGVFPVLLKDAGLPAALNALGESRRLVAHLDTDQRYPDVIETTIYLLVGRLCEAGSTIVSVRRDRSRLLVEASVTGRSPILVEPDDRIRTLGGDLELTTTDDATSVTAALPIELDA